MSGKISVSLLGLIAYGFVVIAGCLLVGLLPVYVNQPICSNSDDTFKTNNRNFTLVKRSALPEKTKALDLCPEFVLPDAIEHVWKNPRLPTYLRPTNYDVQIDILDFNKNIYEGFVTVNVDLFDQTDTFLLHKKNIFTRVEQLEDKLGALIDIGCYGIYEQNDYYIFKTISYVSPDSSPLKIKYYFNGSIDLYEYGIFKLAYGDKANLKNLVISKFEPLYAREAFPCFDEPSFKATFKLTLNHPNGTTALSNSQFSDISETGVGLRTIFETTPRLSTYLFGFVIFNYPDFGSRFSFVQPLNNRVFLYARKELVDENYVDEPLLMATNLLSALENILPEVASDLPKTIEIFASPFYPNDGIDHYGLMIFDESKILFRSSSASERDRQNAALTMAKTFCEFFFGNYVTFSWWNELWLQEGLSDYLKYRIVDLAYPQWNIYDQFITEELIQVLVEDSYPSSHPVYKEVNSPFEIYEYFDKVESSKVLAVLRMIEEETSKTRFITALQTYLEANSFGIGSAGLFFSQLGQIRGWRVDQFADIWFSQSNYPLLTIKTESLNGQFSLRVMQERALTLNNNTDVLYESPYNWTWYVPLTCLMGNSATTYVQKLNITEKDQVYVIGNGSITYDWFHCDTKFVSYFAINYDHTNWLALKNLLAANLRIIEPTGRSSIIHNLFHNAYANRIAYHELTQYSPVFINEDQYIPWRTVFKHLNDMFSVLEYKKAFYQVSTYFSYILNNNQIQNLWETTGNHVQELLSETIIELGCKSQDEKFLNNITSLWNSAVYSSDKTLDARAISNHIISSVYKYHIQNTNDKSDWYKLYNQYSKTNDPVEKQRIFEALTFTYDPSLLNRFFNNTDNLFSRIYYLSKTQVGRQIAWEFLAIKYEILVAEYGLGDNRLGQSLVDVSNSFENNLIASEFVRFIATTNSGVTVNVKRKTTEKIVSNLLWIELKQDEIIDAFSARNKINNIKRKF